MMSDYLEFEQPIAELEEKIEELRRVESDNEMQLGEEIAKLQAKCHALTESIYKNLSAWQVAQIARRPARPYTLDELDSSTHSSFSFPKDSLGTFSTVVLDSQQLRTV